MEVRVFSWAPQGIVRFATMMILLKFIGFPLIVALLTWVLLELIQINRKEKLNQLVKVLSVVIALFVGLMNSSNAICNKREVKASEIVGLVPKIAHAINYEIEAGDICYTYGGEQSVVYSDAVFKANETLRANLYVLDFKLKSFSQHKIKTASSNFSNAIKDIREYCTDVQPKELSHKKSVVNDTAFKLVKELGILVAKCY